MTWFKVVLTAWTIFQLHNVLILLIIVRERESRRQNGWFILGLSIGAAFITGGIWSWL